MNLLTWVRLVLLACFVLVAEAAAADPLILTEQTILRALDGSPLDHFGIALALSGDTLVVGAPGQYNLPGDGAGAAYIFVRSGSSWHEQARLRPSNPYFVSAHGAAVAISGDTVVVGGWSSTHVFVRTGSSWSEQAQLQDLSGGMMGWSVAISGDTAVSADVMNGWIHIFVRSGSSWSEQARLDSPQYQDWFGCSVALSGDTLVVGANLADDRAGAAYVYQRSGSTWSQQAKLVAADRAPDDKFGNSVALSGDRIAVGINPPDNSEGAVYTFVRSGSSWNQEAKLLSSNGDPMGRSVALSGDLLVAGAPIYLAAGGSAHVFAHRGSAWSEQMVLVPSEQVPRVQFGPTVALSGTTVVVGELVGDAIPGAAYVFPLDEFTTVAPTTGLITTEDGGRATFTVGLRVLPVGEVVIDLGSTNTDEGTVSPAQLTFTPDDWSTPQTVTLTGIDDFVVDDGQLYTVSLTMNTELTEDPIYDGTDPPDVAAANLPLEGDFYTVTPCRVLDTRLLDQALVSGEERVVTFHGVCGVPETARAVALQLTVVHPTSGGKLTLYPGDLPKPDLSTVAFAAGPYRTCGAIVLLAVDGTGTLTARPLLDGGGSTHLVIDVADISSRREAPGLSVIGSSLGSSADGPLPSWSRPGLKRPDECRSVNADHRLRRYCRLVLSTVNTVT
jgi:hypothetical protein